LQDPRFSANEKKHGQMATSAPLGEAYMHLGRLETRCTRRFDVIERAQGLGRFLKATVE
jgi:hypothetical protein